MASSSLTALRSCTPSFTDKSFVQLQLFSASEVAAKSCSPSPNQTSRRPRIPAVTASKIPLARVCVRKEECSTCGCRPCASFTAIASSPRPSDRFENGFMKQELGCSENRRKHRTSSIVCAAENSMIDRCSNDADDVASSAKSDRTEEVFSALHRSLLEVQWAFQARQSGQSEAKRSDSEFVFLNNCIERGNASMPSQEMVSSVVRSRKASARSRRLLARVKAAPVGHVNATDSCKSLSFANSTQHLVKKKKGRVKLNPLHDFVSSFLKPTNGCGMLDKDEEKGFTKQMRICQSLEKAKHELKKKLGHEPSRELWAHSVDMSTEQLIRMVREGEIARNKMVRSHMRLVVSVARAYQNHGVDMADLILEGSKGLLRGLDRFDHRKGLKISTYVHWWIRQGITRAIANHSRLVRIPVYLHEIMFAVKKAKRLLHNQGRPVTVENLSVVLNVPKNRIERALQVKQKLSSFDKSDGSYGLKMEYDSYHEFVADRMGKNDPWNLFNEEVTIEAASGCLTLLTSREQDVIRWAYGIGTKGGKQSSLSSIALKLGLSEERVRQLKVRALSKMRQKKDDDSLAFIDILDHL